MTAAIPTVVRAAPGEACGEDESPCEAARHRCGAPVASALRGKPGSWIGAALGAAYPGPKSQDRHAGQSCSALAAIGLAALLACSGVLLVGQAAYIHAKALLAQALLERAFARTLETGRPTKPWSWADTRPVARIEVPRLRQHAIVLASSSGQALAFGPGHVEDTPEPGEPGTAVYSAHRDTHFSFVKDMRVGDTMMVSRRDGARKIFRVTGMSVVRWDASGLDPLGPGRNLVLSTCWPFDGRTAGPLRYLVHAELAEP
jgi:sortase A